MYGWTFSQNPCTWGKRHHNQHHLIVDFDHLFVSLFACFYFLVYPIDIFQNTGIRFWIVALFSYLYGRYHCRRYRCQTWLQQHWQWISASEQCPHSSRKHADEILTGIWFSKVLIHSQTLVNEQICKIKLCLVLSCADCFVSFAFI